METKEFKQELDDLKKGLERINEIMEKCKDNERYKRASHTKEIQEARIEFFKRGYGLTEVGKNKNIMEYLP